MKYAQKKIWLILLLAVIGGCKTYDNFTTYFNTYYNAKRLLKETETEFEYYDEKKRIKPKIIIPQPNFWIIADNKSGAPPFMNEFIIDARKLQPMKVKLDSVIIKGSKILAKHPKSDFVENTLFLMAQSYFYQNDWLNCQVKCSELIDKFPEGDLSPDAHLMIAKTYLIRKKTLTGKTLLSQAVDMAWLKNRYDILSEAFRLEAELALYENNFDDALRPYKQAIAQCDDNEQNARWQVDMAALLYRIKKFDKAEIAFSQVKNYSPDYQAEYEADFYQAVCKIRNGKTEEGMNTLDKLDNDGKFEEWKEYALAGRMIKYMVNNEDTLFADAERIADSLYVNNPMIHAVYFEKAMNYYDSLDYENAKKYLAQVRTIRNEYFNTSNKLYNMLNDWGIKRNTVFSILKSHKGNRTDSINASLSLSSFEYGRLYELLGRLDSAEYYYKFSTETSPVDSSQTAQFMYNYSRIIRPSNPLASDSLMEILAEKYPKTEYGQDAINALGYTQFFAVDTIADIYSSGNQLRKNGEYPLAISRFNTVFSSFPSSHFAPKALYSIGWIYENRIKNSDSAYKYYSLLLKNYPKTEYAKDVRLMLAYMDAVKSGEPMPDSLKQKQVFITPRRDFLNEIKEDKEIEIKKSTNFDKQKPVKNNNNLDPNKYFQDVKGQYDPKNILSKPKEMLENPESLLPGVNFKNPLEEFMQKDSTETNKKVEAPKEEKKK